MKLRRAFVGLLALLLLFAQQAAFAHAVSHLGKEPPPKEQLVHGKLCGKCASFEKLSHAAPSRSAVILPVELVFSQPAVTDYFYCPRRVAPFQSRAPPVFL